ncbi:cell division protein ZapA [Caloramator fervidus]|uniref:Cell division protein ZapA n=1 Tax=Caloramator fervidus TaxID=29344 RepID=A0A1H5U8A6_9CLOT|nr:cell division protein ZapA [Caloramator fervidus]SEF70591.1 cell division protein ZapA [Caloramator fervidus]
MKNRVNVRINGCEYTLTGTEPEEYLFSLANFVDKKIKEIRSSNINHNDTSAAVLAALLICDELFKLKKELEELKSYYNDSVQRLEGLQEEFQRLYSQYNLLIEENTKLKEENKTLKESLEEAKRQYEDLDATFEAFDDEYQKMQSEVKILLEEKEKLEEELNELKSKLLESEFEIVRLKKDLNNRKIYRG